MSCTGFGSANPVLRVANLSASVDYFVQVLGFKIDWLYPGLNASVSRDRCCLFLCQGDQGNPGSWAWIGVPDVAALFEELTLRGARVRQPPTNFHWAYEMQIEDFDGNVLRFGSEPLADRPFGPWFDMRGEYWQETAQGWQKLEEGK